MFHIALPVCCGLHLANNYRTEPNQTINKITSFVIPILAAAGLGFAVGRFPGNFFEGISCTFIPYPIARALSALKAICVQHGQSFAAFLGSCSPDAVIILCNVGYYALSLSAFFAPHFIMLPVISCLAYAVFGIGSAISTYAGPNPENLIAFVIFESIPLIFYTMRNAIEYATGRPLLN